MIRYVSVLSPGPYCCVDILNSFKRVWRLPQFLCLTWSPLVCCVKACFFDTVWRPSLFLLFTRSHCQLCWPNRHYWISVAETATSLVGLFIELWFSLSRWGGDFFFQQEEEEEEEEKSVHLDNNLKQYFFFY